MLSFTCEISSSCSFVLFRRFFNSFGRFPCNTLINIGFVVLWKRRKSTGDTFLNPRKSISESPWLAEPSGIQYLSTTAPAPHVSPAPRPSSVPHFLFVRHNTLYSLPFTPLKGSVPFSPAIRPLRPFQWCGTLKPVGTNEAKMVPLTDSSPPAKRHSSLTSRH